MVSNELAQLNLKGSVINRDKAAKNETKLLIKIFNPGKKLVYQQEEKLKTPFNTPYQFSKAISITKPELWSPDRPSLYTAEITLTESRTNKVVDQLSIPIGLRWFSVDTKNGFMLNGKA